MQHCNLYSSLAGTGHRIQQTHLDRGVGCRALLATGAGEVTTFLVPLGEHTEHDSSEHELSERELGVSDVILGVRRLGCCD
jgi:hypothetical protein